MLALTAFSHSGYNFRIISVSRLTEKYVHHRLAAAANIDKTKSSFFHFYFHYCLLTDRSSLFALKFLCFSWISLLTKSSIRNILSPIYFGLLLPVLSRYISVFWTLNTCTCVSIFRECPQSTKTPSPLWVSLVARDWCSSRSMERKCILGPWPLCHWQSLHAERGIHERVRIPLSPYPINVYSQRTVYSGLFCYYHSKIRW